MKFELSAGEVLKCVRGTARSGERRGRWPVLSYCNTEHNSSVTGKWFELRTPTSKPIASGETFQCVSQRGRLFCRKMFRYISVNFRLPIDELVRSAHEYCTSPQTNDPFKCSASSVLPNVEYSTYTTTTSSKFQVHPPLAFSFISPPSVRSLVPANTHTPRPITW